MSNQNGRFGEYGGQYIPETLMNAVTELEHAYEHYKNRPDFKQELEQLYHDYAGRPSRLTYAAHMTQHLGGAKIYLKREDLNHTGSHKINNVIGQCLLAKRWENKADCGDRRRTAWSCDCNRSGADGDGMRGFYGRRGYEKTGAERIPYAPARCKVHPVATGTGRLRMRCLRRSGNGRGALMIRII